MNVEHIFGRKTSICAVYNFTRLTLWFGLPFNLSEYSNLSFFSNIVFVFLDQLFANRNIRMLMRGEKDVDVSF